VRFDRRELAGAVADVGVLVPIAVALIVGNGLSATAVLLPAGLLYVTAAWVYRLPVPVQPLKAFGVIERFSARLWSRKASGRTRSRPALS
jgi:sulfate permease, SulP family